MSNKKVIVSVRELKKTFKLSRKQQKLNKTNDKIKTAVNGISFDVYEGEIFGLLGPNGAGKTTTMRILSTLVKADSGDADVKGYRLSEAPEEIRKSIGFLTSELKLEDYFTPNYLFDYFSSLYEIDKSVLLERKKKLFGVFGIDKYAETKIGEMSTGMKQKVSLVISLVNDPDIIIFDEPTNGLDIVAAKTVTDFLISLKEQGKTVIISTHIFEIIEKLCDRVGIVVNGEMVLCDDKETLTEYKSMEEVFFEVYNCVIERNNDEQ